MDRSTRVDGRRTATCRSRPGARNSSAKSVNGPNTESSSFLSLIAACLYRGAPQAGEQEPFDVVEQAPHGDHAQRARVRRGAVAPPAVPSREHF
jgi:hypothetical protein